MPHLNRKERERAEGEEAAWPRKMKGTADQQFLRMA